MNLSFVIPTFNEEKFIAKCLDAVMNQTVPPHEVIVVDNNSLDQTVQIASRYPVRVVHEKLQGVSYARRTGVDATTGDIIARIDADTRIPPNWSENVLKTMSDPDVVGVSGPIKFYDLPRWFVFPNLLAAMQRILFFSLSKVIFDHEVLFGSQMAFKKSAWMKIQDEVCMQNNIHEDTDLSIHIAPHGKSVFDPMLVAEISCRRARSLGNLVEYAVMHVRGLAHGIEFKKQKATSRNKTILA